MGYEIMISPNGDTYLIQTDMTAAEALDLFEYGGYKLVVLPMVGLSVVILDDTKDRIPHDENKIAEDICGMKGLKICGHVYVLGYSKGEMTMLDKATADKLTGNIKKSIENETKQNVLQ